MPARFSVCPSWQGILASVLSDEATSPMLLQEISHKVFALGNAIKSFNKPTFAL